MCRLPLLTVTVSRWETLSSLVGLVQLYNSTSPEPSQEQITRLLIGVEAVSLAVLPTFDLNKVRDKTRDGTFEEDVIVE